jgi:hypothetical protein
MISVSVFEGIINAGRMKEQKGFNGMLKNFD